MHTCVEGSKRQLPAWMIQKVSASNVSNSSNVVETNCPTKDGDVIAANVREENHKKETSRRKPGEKDHKKETSRRKSNPNAKCEDKGRKNLDQLNGNSDDITEKKRKGNRAPRSSAKKCKILEDVSHASSDDTSRVQASSDDDDIELTVEDLMAIAEQFVKDYENNEQRETTSRQCESKQQFSATTEAGTTLDSTCQNKKSSNSEREALYKSAPTTGDLIPTSTCQTDHPARDMLDVLLGPLLRTTIEKEKSKSSLESLHITHEFARENKNELVGDEIIPLRKKRSTLKEQVAMLLL